MSLLNQITIIIPTHYRHKYLNRILSYYKDSGIKILVADSTDIEFKNRDDFIIDYFHYPDSKLLEKFVDIVKKVETPYMLFCADDDFWVKESVIPCVEFLENNTEYSSVQGNYIGFENNKNISFIPSYLHALSIEDDSISKRLNTNMSSYMPLFYSMHRTDIIKRIFSDNYNTKITHAILIELSVSIYSLVYGKHKVLNMLTYARDYESLSTPGERDNLKIISEKKEFREQYNQFILNITNLIEEKNKNLNGKNIIIEAFNYYIDTIKINTTIIFIKKYFRFSVLPIRALRRFYNKKRLFSSLKNIKGYPISDEIAIDSWKNIEKILQKHRL